MKTQHTTSHMTYYIEIRKGRGMKTKSEVLGEQRSWKKTEHEDVKR